MEKFKNYVNNAGVILRYTLDFNIKGLTALEYDLAHLKFQIHVRVNNRIPKYLINNFSGLVNP